MSWLEDQPSEYLQCRDTGIGHRWEPSTAYREGRDFVEELVCPRCSTMKKRRLTPTALIKGAAKTSYPEGYVRKGLGRLSKSENAAVRLEGLRRRYPDMED